MIWSKSSFRPRTNPFSAFGETTEGWLTTAARMEIFATLDQTVMVGASQKSPVTQLGVGLLLKSGRRATDSRPPQVEYSYLC